ncbi:HNH endonuclease [Cereibacter sphaeroides]|uniref:HNH endonuclease n=1 Tax=Cereibacter sphaeroides TaxID=1063 RepID=UPI001F15DFC4|nr:HNH endonuclease signature motif containing protein [Cereibacter sphaeroides]MCE6958126.1 HNH endonuclease [Cereibacter sphaeroides]MCE6971637.1 HNH endonuclease [Cereibacter sphaeroides]
MQHLPFPAAAKDDEAEINKLTKKPEWEPHKGAWIAAYRAYRENSGSPFAIFPYDFGPGVGDRQYALYDTRKGSGELRRMRRKEGLKSCPICGSPVTGDLDHYLPRAAYPEFSIMRANLIPACTHCNSGGKRTTVHGGEPRRFIHPYFDDWSGQEIWYVEIVPPFKAAQFVPLGLPGLGAPRDQIVEFHLNNVLGTQFQLSMATEWSSLPTQIKLRDNQLSIASVTRQVDQELRVARAAKGQNSWQAALLRGIQRSPDAIQYLRDEAIVAVLPPGA